MRARPRPCALACALLIGALPALAHEPLDRELAELEARLAVASPDVRLVLRHAELLRVRGETERALGDCERARELGGAASEIDALRARVLFEAGRFEGALAAARAAPARIVEARALAALGRPAEAADAYALVLSETAYPSPDLYLERSAAVVARGPAHLAEALAGIEAGIARIGPAVTLELEALELERRLGRIDAALARLDGLADRSPRKAPWLLRRAELLARAGRRGEARAAIGAARRSASDTRGELRLEETALAALVESEIDGP